MKCKKCNFGFVTPEWRCDTCDAVYDIQKKWKADKAVIEAVFEWLKKLDAWCPPDPSGRAAFDEAEMTLRHHVEAHPDYKEGE